jgi:glycerol-3-phosphate dehydrogenase
LGKTRRFRLDGAPQDPWDVFVQTETASLCRRHSLSERSARHLVQRYGRRAPEVAAYLDQDPALGKPVVEGEPDLQVEFPYQRDHEMATYPADHLLRRTRLGLFHPVLLHSLEKQDLVP